MNLLEHLIYVRRDQSKRSKVSSTVMSRMRSSSPGSANFAMVGCIILSNVALNARHDLP